MALPRRPWPLFEECASFIPILVFFHLQNLMHCRRFKLERQLASSQVPKEQQLNLIKDLERKETEYMRLKRHKICVGDFELLTIIGRGAFGEVCKLTFNIYFSTWALLLNPNNICYCWWRRIRACSWWRCILISYFSANWLSTYATVDGGASVHVVAVVSYVHNA